MEEVNFPELFEQWLAKRDSKFSARVKEVEDNPAEKFTEEDMATLLAYNKEYAEKRQRKLEEALFPRKPQPFKEWLSANYPKPNALSPQTISALARQFHGEPIIYDPTYEEMTLGGTRHVFPPAYFSTFNDNNVFTVEMNDLKTTQNPEVRSWRENEGKCVHPSLDPNNPFMDFARDKDRSMNIVVETENEEGCRVFKMVHVVQGDSESSAGNYGDNQNVVSESEPESLPLLSESERGDTTDGAVSESEEERNFTRLMRFYTETKLESYGVNLQTFSSAMKAYYQALMYRLPGIISKVLPAHFTLYGQERANAAIVFCLNGNVYLDVFKPEYELQCTKVNTEAGYLRVPFRTSAILRMPFNKEQGVFEHPLIICDKEFAALLPIANLHIEIPRIVLPKGKTVLDVAEEFIKQTELSDQMKDLFRGLIAKNGAGKIRREPMQGKNRGKIIGGVALGSFFLAGAIILGLIPGGQFASALAWLGVSAEAAASTGIVAGAAVGTTGATAGVSASIAAFIYWLKRKGFREFKHFTLKNVIPRLETHQADVAKVLPILMFAQSLDEELNGTAELEQTPRVAHSVQRRHSSPAFFQDVDKPNRDDKGKEEMVVVRGRSHSK